MATISLTDSIFKKLNDEELLLINELYLKMKKYKNIIDELENWLNIQQNISSPEQIINDIFDKIKELKGEDNND